MTLSEFKDLTEINPHSDLSPELQSLWWDMKENWEKSHEIAQDINSSDGHWIHAYLHRKEGDIWNADFGMPRQVKRGQT